MSTRTDVWMPLYIGDYLGDTSRLTTEQHGAYLLLIMDYWRKGPLPNDPLVLAQITKMSVDAWSIAQAVLMHFFQVGDDNCLHHRRIDAELNKAAENLQKRTVRAKKGAEARWNHDENASSNATSTSQALLEQCPSPSPSPKDKNKQKPSRSASNKDSDPRHVPFQTACKAYADHKKVAFVWDGREAGELAALLKAVPSLELGDFQVCLRHRARSDVPHGERPSLWLATITRYQEGPLNTYNKPAASGGTHGTLRAESLGNRKADAANAALAAAQLRVQDRAATQDHDEAGGDVSRPRGSDGSATPGYLLDRPNGEF